MKKILSASALTLSLLAVSHAQGGLPKQNDVEENNKMRVAQILNIDTVATSLASAAETSKDFAANQAGTGQALFPEDVLPNNRQSIPSKVNVPLGLSHLFNVEYVGHFRAVSRGESKSDYAVGAMGINSARGSIYLAGHAHHGAIAEFKIPKHLSMDENPKDVVAAKVLQRYVKVLPSSKHRVHGIYPYESGLLVSGGEYYDGSADNKKDMYVYQDANNLKDQKPKVLEVEGNAFVSGYMFPIPEHLQAKFGAEHAIGWSSVYAITSRLSQGPSIYAFDPAQALKAESLVKTEVKQVYKYPEHELVGNGSRAKDIEDPMWGSMAQANYGFIVPGTSYFLATGKHAGLHSGSGYKIKQTGRDKACPGFCPHEVGDEHNYFWVYDMNEILAAKEPWDTKPISYGKWSHPFDKGGQKPSIGGTFDPKTNILYLSIGGAGRVGHYDRPPMIIAYKITAKDPKSITQ